jgi:hypothetical protein
VYNIILPPRDATFAFLACFVTGLVLLPVTKEPDLAILMRSGLNKHTVMDSGEEFWFPGHKAM